MKIKSIPNIDEFFKVIDCCSGRVELLTGEGDRLNLKSKLCQFISIANIFSSDDIDIEIVASEGEDLHRICQYFAENKKN